MPKTCSRISNCKITENLLYSGHKTPKIIKIYPLSLEKIHNYYDAPRLGIAELNGVPHVYESEFDESKEEWSETYFLSPIDAELLALILEDWAIWRRWRDALLRGEVTPHSGPALPHERMRHEELKRAIGGRLKSDPMNRLEFKAKFTINPGTGWEGTLVEWQPLTDRTG